MLMVNDESIEQDSIDLTVEDCGVLTSVVVVSFEPSTVLKTVKSSQKYSFFCTFPFKDINRILSPVFFLHQIKLFTDYQGDFLL